MVSTTPTVDIIQQRGTVLVGTTGDYRPLSYKEPETGTYWGFDLDVAGEIAKKMNVSVTYVPTSWPTLTADVEDPALFDFAIGGINEKFARANLPNCTLIVFDKNEEIPNQVAEGKADGSLRQLHEKYGLIYAY